MPIRQGAMERHEAVASRKKHNANHPMLRTGRVTNDVWNYIYTHPGCTLDQITDGTGINHQRVSDLLREGLIKAEGLRGARKYYVAEGEALTGQGRDKLEVELEIFRNERGEYSVSAKLLGERATAHDYFPFSVMTKTVKIFPPSIEENITEIEPSLTIDADYIIIDDD